MIGGLCSIGIIILASTSTKHLFFDSGVWSDTRFISFWPTVPMPMVYSRRSIFFGEQ